MKKYHRFKYNSYSWLFFFFFKQLERINKFSLIIAIDIYSIYTKCELLDHEVTHIV